MSLVYLIRHGQAGTRHNYDELSELGRTQARLLGEYLAAQGLRFDAAFAGAMCRQQQTAQEAAAAIRRAGGTFPEIQVVPGWNEFDLDRVYREMGPVLASADEEFRREYERMRAEARAHAGDPTADVHRRWSRCDIRMIDAWVRGLYPYQGESWDTFVQRVSDCRTCFDRARGDTIVFTSATPIGIWAGSTLGIADQRVMALAGVLYNSSITTLKLTAERTLLFSLNGVPHLAKAALRTHR